jgi:hypothetical protein
LKDDKKKQVQKKEIEENLLPGRDEYDNDAARSSGYSYYVKCSNYYKMYKSATQETFGTVS